MTRGARLIRVIETTATCGKGTPSDPERVVTQYWSKKGDLLARYDPDDLMSHTVRLYAPCPPGFALVSWWEHVQKLVEAEVSKWHLEDIKRRQEANPQERVGE